MLALIIEKIINKIQKNKYKSYKKHFKDPENAQRESLRKILERTSKTEIRKRLGLSNINSLEDFIKNCPITTYDDYQELTTQLYKSQNIPNLLTKESACYFVVTSGTSSTPKYIPLTAGYTEEFQRVMLSWLGCIKQNRPETFLGKILFLADVSLVGVSDTGIPCGVMSGYNFRKIPVFLRKRMYSSDECFYDLGDNKKKDIALLAHSINSDLTLIGSIMPETIINFLNRLFLYKDEVLSYLETGMPPFDYPKKYKRKLKLKPNAKVISRVKNVILQDKINSIKDIYPNLKTVICWKSSTAKFYLERVSHLIPKDVVVWDGIYSASEGWFNFPDSPEQIGGPVAVYGQFLEFREIGAEGNDLLQAWMLKEGREYEIFVTSSMGFFRYQMNDKVKVTGMRDKTPIIEFIEKTGLYLDHAMERITSRHVQELMERVISEQQLDHKRIRYFTMSPCSKSDLYHYCLIIETDYDQKVFNEVDVNNILEKINPNYKRNIDSKLLGKLRVVVISPGHIQKELKIRESKNMSIAQFKYSPIEKDIGLTNKVCPCVQ